MKKLILSLLLIAGSVAYFSSCKKDSTDKATLDAQVQQFNTDNGNYKSESDQADDDINNDLTNHPSVDRLSGGGQNNVLSSPLCGVTIDTHDSANKILYYNFDGVTPCFSPSRTRSGQIKVQLTTGLHWSDVASVLTLTYTNFKITRLSDNKSIMFNGIKTLKNVNGNNWLGFLLSTATLKYQERALNIAVTFDGGASATWNSARMTEWSYTAAGVNSQIPYAYISFTSSGDTTVNGFTSVDTWGTNRYSQAFTTHYSSPIVSNTYCGLWRFNSGEVSYHINSADYTFKFGVDQSGNPTPYACAYGFKVTWLPSGSSTLTDVILSY